MTTRQKRERRYKSVLDAPLGRKAYWEYKTRHNAIPSLHQLKTMRRGLAAKDAHRRLREAIASRPVYKQNRDIKQARLEALRAASGTFPIPVCPGVPFWSCSRVKGHDGPCALLPRPFIGRMSSTESNLREQDRLYHTTDGTTTMTWDKPDMLPGDNDLVTLAPGLKDHRYWPHLRAYEDVVTGRFKTVDSLERKLYSRMVDRQTHDEGELMRPEYYDPTPTQPTQPTSPASPSHPVVTMIDTRQHAAFPLSSFRAGDMIVPRNNPSVVAVKIDNQSVMYLNTGSGAGSPSLVRSNFAGSLFMRPASVSVTVEL